MQTATKNRNPLVDWPIVRQEYESTKLSAAALARKHGTTAAGITYHAKRSAWKRPDDHSAHHNSIPSTEIVLDADSGQLTAAHISDDIEALAAMRDRIVGQHKVDVSRDAAYLNALEKNIMEKKSAPLQKLNSLATIVKIRAQLIELERQAHSILEKSGERAAVAVQVNVNVSPQDAYLQMTGKK